MNAKVVTRFAPSPTGYLHIGSLRTVLYNVLFARQHDGEFLLRIEDTDRSRYVEGSIENLIEILESVGLSPDHGPDNPDDRGPYIQSERLDIYKKYEKKLLDEGKAYRCFCSAERLDNLREEQKSLGLPTKYDKKCRFLTQEEIQENLDADKPYIVRLKVPENREIVFEDMVRGKISVQSKDIDEQVLIKSDGFPTYHLAATVDDALMGVTHVIRGEEWIPSTPKHILIHEALDFEPPVYCHLPLLLGMDKKKLSKRTGDVSVSIYLEKGFLVEAIINYIALLGWNPKTTQEIFTFDELVDKFDMTQIQSAGAVFDIERLTWFNAEYIKNMETSALKDAIFDYLKKYDSEFHAHIQAFPEDYNLKIIDELKTRLKTLSEFKDLTNFFYSDDISIDSELLVKPKMKINDLDQAKEFLRVALDFIDTTDIDSLTQDEIKDKIIVTIKESGHKNGQILWPVRVALSGEQYSPGAIELLYILGKEKSRQRIQKALNL